jgi:hypothetical protein
LKTLSQIAPPSPNLGLGDDWVRKKVREKIMKKMKFMVIGSIGDKIADI